MRGRMSSANTGLFGPDFCLYFASFRQAFLGTWFFRKTAFRRRSAALRLVLHLIFVAASSSPGRASHKSLSIQIVSLPKSATLRKKRRAEQIKVVECNRKANEAKVMPRDRTAYLNHCLEAAGEK
jgi:hypothetical protein